MCVQVSYGLMAVAAPGTLPPKMPNGPLERKHHIDGVFNYVLHTRLHIRRPCTVTQCLLNRGFRVLSSSTGSVYVVIYST